MRYKITVPYRNLSQDHWESQTEQGRVLYDLGCRNISWCSARICPKGWTGYTDENPSPGVDIKEHVWEVEATPDVLLCLMLKFGITIHDENKN